MWSVSYILRKLTLSLPEGQIISPFTIYLFMLFNELVTIAMQKTYFYVIKCINSFSYILCCEVLLYFKVSWLMYQTTEMQSESQSSHLPAKWPWENHLTFNKSLSLQKGNYLLSPSVFCCCRENWMRQSLSMALNPT